MIQSNINTLPPSNQITAHETQGSIKLHGDKLLEHENPRELQASTTAATSTGPELIASSNEPHPSPSQRSATEEIKQMWHPNLAAQQLYDTIPTSITTTTRESSITSSANRESTITNQKRAIVDLITEPWETVESLGFGKEPQRLFRIHRIPGPVDPISEAIHRGALTARKQQRLVRPSAEIREMWEECKNFPDAFSASWVPQNVKKEQQQQQLLKPGITLQSYQASQFQQPIQIPSSSGTEHVVRAQKIEEHYKYTEESPVITEIASDSILKQYPNIQQALKQQQMQQRGAEQQAEQHWQQQAPLWQQQSPLRQQPEQYQRPLYQDKQQLPQAAPIQQQAPSSVMQQQAIPSVMQQQQQPFQQQPLQSLPIQTQPTIQQETLLQPAPPQQIPFQQQQASASIQQQAPLQQQQEAQQLAPHLSQSPIPQPTTQQQPVQFQQQPVQFAQQQPVYAGQQPVSGAPGEPWSKRLKKMVMAQK